MGAVQGINIRHLLKCLIAFGLVSTYLSITGCATYGKGVESALAMTQQGNYQGAATAVSKSLSPTGSDKLLYHTELGLINHLNGNFSQSNALLEQANTIADDLYTKRVSDILASTMSNPRNSTYGGTDFEQVFINYYKAMNYLMMAESATSFTGKTSALEGARVEARRINLKLNAISDKQGTYKDQKDQEEKTFYQLNRIFQALSGNMIDRNKLIYRQDAWVNYLTGLVYEEQKEWDSARISYVKAAELYEQGFVDQYELDQGMVEQSWFDAIRIMRRSGDYENEWPDLARQKLSNAKRNELSQFDNKGNLVVIEHVGMVPQRKELNFWLRLDEAREELILEPILTGNRQERKDQFAWFFMLYADKGLIQLVQNYNNDGLGGAIEGLFRSKRVGLFGMWDLAENLGLLGAAKNGGLRVTVPYYEPLRNRPGRTQIQVDGQTQNALLSGSLAQLAMQQQLYNAQDDLQSALAREALKGIAQYRASEQLQKAGGAGALLAFATKVATVASSAAETRNWLTLPYDIRVSRIPVEPGSHNVQISTQVKPNRAMTVSNHQIEIKAGEQLILKNRSFETGLVSASTN